MKNKRQQKKRITKKNKRNTHKAKQNETTKEIEKKINLPTRLVFMNDFLHLVYMFFSERLVFTKIVIAYKIKNSKNDSLWC